MTTSDWGPPIDPGKSFRWRLKNERDEVSSEWVIFTAKNSDDVYLVTRDTEGITKVSFHASGTWNSGLTREAADKRGIKPKDRHVLQLFDRDEIAPGWVLAAQICVPNTQLRPPLGKESRKVNDLPASSMDEATIVEIYFQEPGQSPNIELKKSYPGCVLKKFSGGFVWVVLRSVNLPWTPEERFHKELKDVRVLLKENEEVRQTFTRDHIYGHDESTGTFIFLEMALDAAIDDVNDRPGE